MKLFKLGLYMGKRTTSDFLWFHLPCFRNNEANFFFSEFFWFHRFYVFSLASSYFFSLTWAGVTLLTLLELRVFVLSGFYDMV